VARALGRALPRAFYGRDSREVAPLLLNKILVHDHPTDGRVAARLVEVEAYAGEDDPGSHGFRGETARTTTMFGAPGHLYVYFTYGMHWCMNVVTAGTGVCSAVLLRAAAPIDGVETMRVRRAKSRRDRDLCSGPAKLTQAFALDGAHDGVDLVRGPVRLVDDGTPPPRRPGNSARIGLATGKGDRERWRWYVVGDENVSRGRPGGG
jgi:DNA-3-methyladenine glycosylase